MFIDTVSNRDSRLKTLTRHSYARAARIGNEPRKVYQASPK